MKNSSTVEIPQAGNASTPKPITNVFVDALTPDDAFALGATILMFAERRLAAVLLQRAEGDLLHNLANLGGDGVVH